MSIQTLWWSHISFHHWTIWGISLQALAFFLASAIQGGSSWGRVGGGWPRWEAGVWPGSPGALDFSGIFVEKGGEVSDLDVGEGFEGDVQEGAFWGTGVGVEGDRDLWGEWSWGAGLAVAGRSWGFGGTGQGRDWALGGWGGTGVGGERVLLDPFSADAAGLSISNALTGRRTNNIQTKRQSYY